MVLISGPHAHIFTAMWVASTHGVDLGRFESRLEHISKPVDH